MKTSRSIDDIEALTVKNREYRALVLMHTRDEIARDKGDRDITSLALFPKRKKVKGFFAAKSNGVLAGVAEIEFFLKKSTKAAFHFRKKDGAFLKRGDIFGSVEGDAREILKIERSVMNFFCRMSGVATLAHRILRKARKINPKIVVAPTRKTLWGLLDKKACAVGGAWTHRLNLADAVLIKDNHLAAAGGDIEYILGMFRGKNTGRFLEIEVSRVSHALKAARLLQELRLERCRVLFDNFKPSCILEALATIKKRHPKNKILFEASGGITEKNIAAYAKTGVDIISMGSLTYGAPFLDMSLELLSEKNHFPMR